MHLAIQRGKRPAKPPVASDSGNVATGIDKGTNQPGERGIGGPNVGTVPESFKETRGIWPANDCVEEL